MRKFGSEEGLLDKPWECGIEPPSSMGQGVIIVILTNYHNNHECPSFDFPLYSEAVYSINFQKLTRINFVGFQLSAVWCILEFLQGEPSATSLTRFISTYASPHVNRWLHTWVYMPSNCQAGKHMGDAFLTHLGKQDCSFCWSPPSPLFLKALTNQYT